MPLPQLSHNLDDHQGKHGRNHVILTSPAFRAYSSELSEFTAEYETAKIELQKMHIPAYLAGHEIKWKLDFASREMEIEILCNCEIPELEEKAGDNP